MRYYEQSIGGGALSWLVDRGEPREGPSRLLLEGAEGVVPPVN